MGREGAGGHCGQEAAARESTGEQKLQGFPTARPQSNVEKQPQERLDETQVRDGLTCHSSEFPFSILVGRTI